MHAAANREAPMDMRLIEQAIRLDRVEQREAFKIEARKLAAERAARRQARRLRTANRTPNASLTVE